jgi:hypothetical protein
MHEDATVHAHPRICPYRCWMDGARRWSGIGDRRTSPSGRPAGRLFSASEWLKLLTGTWPQRDQGGCSPTTGMWSASAWCLIRRILAGSLTAAGELERVLQSRRRQRRGLRGVLAGRTPHELHSSRRRAYAGAGFRVVLVTDGRMSGASGS